MKKEFTNSTRYWSIRQTYGNWCDHFCMHTPSKYSKSWKILRLLKTVRPRSHILTLFRLVCVNVYAFCVLSSIRWIEILVNKNAVVANVNAHATNTENMKQCKHFCADWCLFFSILQFEILFDDDYRAGTTGCANTSSNSLLLCFFRRFWIVLFPFIAIVCNEYLHVQSCGLSAVERYLWQITVNLNDIGSHIDFTSTLDISQNCLLFVLCLVGPNAAV